MHLQLWGSQFFENASWPAVLLVGNLDSSGHESCVPLPPGETDASYIYERDELQPLWDILEEDGANEIFVCCSRTADDDSRPVSEAAAIPPSRPYASGSYGKIDGVSTYSHFLFDRTGQWGFIGTFEDEGVMGGEPEFMVRFIEKAGGVEELQRRFRTDILNEHESSPYDLSSWRQVYEKVG